MKIHQNTYIYNYLLLFLLLFSNNVFSATVNLAWDASTSANVGGYKVFYGQNTGNYTSSVDVGNATTYALSGLQEGVSYYFAMKAYDVTQNTESAFSNEVTFTVPVTSTITADFKTSQTTGDAGMTVNYNPVTTGIVSSWQWSFPGSYTPDVTNSTAQAVTVTYPNSGTYSVSLTINGVGGSVTKTYSNLITVTAPATLINPPIQTPPPTVTPVFSETTKVGLVAAYGFEEVSGLTVADASGNANHGTISNAVRISTGRYGKALEFNGTNAWVTVNESASLDLSTGMTLEAWVYPTVEMNNWATVIMKEQTGQQVYTLYANTDSNQPALDPWINGSENLLSGGTILSPNQWWHLVGTYDGHNEILYINGEQVAIRTQANDILTSSGALRIGGDSIWGEYFQGYIDEVRIYNRALSIEEVNYNLATAINVSNPPQFVMGAQALESSVDYIEAGTAIAHRVVPQNTGVVTSVQVYLDSSSTATELISGIYQDNNGHPGRLVGQGKLTALIPGAWNTVPIRLVSVSADQPYWLAMLGSNGNLAFFDQEEVSTGSGAIEVSTSSSLTRLSRTWDGFTLKVNAVMSLFGDGY